MNPSSATVSPLRQRMLDDMRMRNLAPKTQSAYVRAVRSLARFLRRPPDTASAEDLRLFQLHLVDAGTSAVSVNATLTGLKFFFDVTLERPEAMSKMQPLRTPRKLPVVLSSEEVAQLIAAAPHIKYQTALSVAYGAGMRVSEIVRLRVADIDSQRMTLASSRARDARIGMRKAASALTAGSFPAPIPCCR
jgi:integrase/recombinase XerD